MDCKIIYGGFNPAWRAGQMERNLVDALTESINNQYPQLKKVIAVTSWHEPAILVKEIQDINPDVTFLCSLTDPLGPIENLIDQLPGRVILIGYVNGEYFFDFWAVACAKFFKTYTVEELEPVQFDNLFLNYNRKPHRHRIEIVKLFEESTLIDQGCITLGNSKYTVSDNENDYLDFGANDVVGNVGIPNDVYSLGQLEIWNRSFINVVSETQYEFSENVFLSEKIFKPMIGLRPFIVNGSPGIYRLLKKSGFDCFDDLFPVEILGNENHNTTWKFNNHRCIIETLINFKNKNLIELYNQIKPRLLYNRELFYEYARNQSIDFKFKI
jgi:hypothetical protein